MEQYTIEKVNKIVRGANRAVYDKEQVHGILDSGFICHVGFNIEEKPFIIPTAYARQGEEIYIHGSAKSRMLRNLDKGIPVCLCVTHLDGLVLARSAFHHSFNYRSAIIYGTAYEIRELDRKEKALELITENILKGRYDEVRKPNEKELKITSVLAIKIENASAKIRPGDPVDDKDDYDLDVWAGVLPIEMTFGKPKDDDLLRSGIPLADSVKVAWEQSKV